MDNLKWIKQHGKKSQGKAEYIAYLETGEKLSPMRAILANCFQCSGYYADGKLDCQIEDCPLHPYMPYRADKTKVKRVRSKKQLEHDRKLPILRSSAL